MVAKVKVKVLDFWIYRREKVARHRCSLTYFAFFFLGWMNRIAEIMLHIMQSAFSSLSG